MSDLGALTAFATERFADAVPIGGIGSLSPQRGGAFHGRFGSTSGGSFAQRTMGAANHAEMPDPVDPIEQAAQQAFIDGFREGERVAMEAAAADDSARLRLAEAIGLLGQTQDGALASALSVAVVRLVKQIMGEVEVDPATLQARCAAVAECIEADRETHVLEVCPDDVPLIDASAIGIGLAPNPSLGRGSVRLATSDGWIEDGPDVRLSRLLALLDDLEGTT